MKRILGIVFLSLLVIAAALVVITLVVLAQPQFGKPPAGEHLAALKKSAQHNGKAFENPGGVGVDMGWAQVPSLLKAYWNAPKNKKPKGPLGVIHPEPAAMAVDTTAHLTWFGHSAFLLEIAHLNVLLDPMLGKASSPFPFLVNRFDTNLAIRPEQLPDIDAVVFSHDHYDHLDYGTILAIDHKVKRYLVPLGLGAHLRHWGVDEQKITELDWWQSTEVDGVQFTCAPAQHFSGRAMNDRGATLWCSWAMQAGDKKLYFSGDSGYGNHFKTIGERLGPFDFAMMECGQYNLMWKAIHMMPEETALAADDVRAAAFMPIHWGMFDLAIHAWTEPIERVSIAAAQRQQNLVTPRIGQRFDAFNPPATDRWWEQVK